MKIKIDKSDKVFSQYIRLRDKECLRCHKPVEFNDKGDPTTHQCSHFQSRRKESTRVDEENACCLCFACHLYFTENPAEHYQWQVERLGQQAVDDLILRSNIYKKRDRAMDYLYWKERYKELKND